jgi:AcrR family transcriptional regulator
MSEKSIAIDAHAALDRRARRTRQLLAEALLNLGAEGDIDAIGVGELAGEAGVGRSTFYQHFASKDDFLIRSFVELLAATEAACAAHAPDRPDIIPSRPLFAHVAGVGAFVRSLVQSEVYPRQMAAGEAKLRVIAEANLARRMPQWSAERRREAAVFIAGGFIGLLRWWMENGLRQPPDRMQAAFERLTQSVLND